MVLGNSGHCCYCLHFVQSATIPLLMSHLPKIYRKFLSEVISFASLSVLMDSYLLYSSTIVLVDSRTGKEIREGNHMLSVFRLLFEIYLF